MKKFLTFLLFSLLMCTPCMAGDGGDGGDEGDDGDGNAEVPMSQSGAGGHNRGQMELPEVYYNQTTGVMTVTFYADGTYQLTVTDTFGLTVYTAPLNTSGIPTAYVMNLAAPGMYLVTISSAYETFTGPLVLQ